MVLSTFELISIGFFVGLGWWLSKLIFVVLVTKFTHKTIELSTGDS